MTKLEKARKLLNKKYPNLTIEEKDNIGIVSGVVDTYEDKLNIGFLLANTHYFEHIVSNIGVNGLKNIPMRIPAIEDQKLDKKEYDVLIIGAGITGCTIARELSKYDLKVLLIDKEEDVAMHASSRNDGNIHVGIDLHAGSLKLHYLHRATKYYEQMCKDLDVDYNQCGQGIALTQRWMIPLTKAYLKTKSKKNNIQGIEFCNKKKIHEYEPNLDDKVIAGAIFHGAGEVNPYLLTIAMAENAMANGVEVSLQTYVKDMDVKDGVIKSVLTNRGIIYPRIVINAAGAFSEDIAIMAKDHFFSIHPRKGTDVILDKRAYSRLSRCSMSILHIGSAGGKTHSKGGGVVPTVDCNILIGPDAVEQPYKEDFSVEQSSIDKVIEKQQEEYKTLSKGDIITYFAGIRAATYEEDFVVQKGKWTKNIIHAAGIQSPGLTCAPAIAEDIAKYTIEVLGDVKKKNNWNGIRKGIIKVKDLSDEERDALIKKNPDYGIMVCRCEEISKGEIMDALASPLPPTTVDGIKRRIRTGMGRCQGGFCQPLVLLLMGMRNKQPVETICKKGDGHIILGDIKGDIHE